MFIPVSDLPSKGRFYNFNGINIEPLNYRQLINKESLRSPTKLARYRDDLELLSDDPNSNQVLLIDADYLIYLKKVITISKGFPYKVVIPCNGHNTTLEMSNTDLDFYELDTNIPEKFELTFSGNKELVKFPRICDVLPIIDRYMTFSKDISVDTIRLMASFAEVNEKPNLIEHLIFNATGSDISKLLFIQDVMLSMVKPVRKTCNICGGELVIDLSDLITSYFRNIQLNFKLSPDEINFK